MATGRKQIVVKRLCELLGELPPDALVEVNAVGNLWVSNTDDEMIAYIDFNGEKVEHTGTPDEA